jgi:hypothetical protein
MSTRVKEVVRKGRWNYGGKVPSEIWIIQQNYIEGPRIEDEEPTPGYPPYDGNGMFYYAAYMQKGAIRGVSRLCRSAEEAVSLAEQTIHGQAEWE